MNLNFKQGIVRQQKNILNQPNFLQISGGNVDFLAINQETIIALSHGTTDYLFSEPISITAAWVGPFLVTNTYWLYWDIDSISGLRTFGHTTLSPSFGPNAPASPAINKHWFDTTNKLMKVWTGSVWNVKIRVFAGEVQNGSVLVQYSTGTQVGLNISSDAGFFIFDEDAKPVKKYDRNNRGVFITTEHPLSTQHARISNVKLELIQNEAYAAENIPKYSPIAFHTTLDNNIIIAKTTLIDNPCVGILLEDLTTGERGRYTTYGYVKENSWNWTENPGTKLWVSNLGQLTTTVPQLNSVQNVGHVVDDKTIFVDIQPLWEYIS